MSLPGLAGLLAVALGLLFARPEVGVMALGVDPTVGGISVRRLLPVTVVLVVSLGALRVWGESRGFLPGALGTALFAVSVAFLIGGLIVWNALRLRWILLAPSGVGIEQTLQILARFQCP